jgi:hypothetical protein
MRAKVYFPGLNGLRFFAALAVVFTHVELMKRFLVYGSHWIDMGEKIPNGIPLEYVLRRDISWLGPAIANSGPLGVVFFFVLSGFLITYLLFEEKKVYNNIHINQSSVGILNTGDLAKIDAVITLTKGTDVELIGKEIENLTQVIIDASDVQGNDKKEIIDLVQSLAEQIQSSRKRSVLVSLLYGLEARIQTVSAAIPIYEKLRPLVERLF